MPTTKQPSNFKEFASHAEVPKNRKWDLAFVLEGKTPQEVMSEIFKDAKALIKIKDSKYESAAKFLKSLELDEALSARLEKLAWWITNNSSLNVVDPNFAMLNQQFHFAYYQFQTEIGPEAPRLFKHAENVAKWAKTPAFKDFRYLLEFQLAEKPHVLSDEIEAFRQQQSRADGNFASVFSILTDAERDKGFAVTSSGRKIKISTANFAKLREDDDKAVRKSATIAYAESFLRNKESLANLLFQHKKAEATMAKVRNYDSAVDMLVFEDRIPKALLTTLYEAVQRNLSVLKKYDAAWRKFYRVKFGEAPTKYDLQRDLIKDDQVVSVEAGVADVFKALAPFGKEYNAVVKRAIDENWVDFHVVKNKRSGAYSSGTYAVPAKLIFMNWDYTPRSTETLAHELGHALHSHYSHLTQRQANASYRIFVAEIASIFNELLLNDYWLKNSQDDNFRFNALTRIIEGFNATVFRQVEWSNYEFDFYNALDKGAPLSTFQAISDLYRNNRLKYALHPKRKLTEHDFVAAISVPHFYYRFYVHKYAIGQLVANIFFEKYEREGKAALQTFIQQFLSVGGSKSNLDTLKDAGVDLLDPNVYDLGFKAYARNVEAWIKLGNKIFFKKA